MSRDEPIFFLHLFGKTGTGKSSTGNTILGHKAFNTKSSLSAVTHTVQEEKGRMGDREVTVVDGPGLVGVNTGVSEETIQQFRRVIELNQAARHAFLIVCRYGERFTEEDEEMVTRLKAVFGPEALRHHAMVVLTCGDNFERDTEDEDMTFKQWCDMQTGAFCDLRKECEFRVFPVDNTKKHGHPRNLFINALEAELESFALDAVTGKDLMDRFATPNKEEGWTDWLERKLVRSITWTARYARTFWDMVLEQ